jgi:hypothetical protein
MSSASQVYLLEIKYCRDSSPQSQSDAALAQHAYLKQQLEEWWRCQVTIVPLLLGVGGTIFKTLEASMKTLGVEGPAFVTMARKLKVESYNALSRE